MHKRNGLALFAALLLLACLVALACVLAALVILELRQGEAVLGRAQLRRAAENAALLGVAQLQSGLGPDIASTWENPPGVLTVKGSAGQAQLAGVWVDGSISARWEARDLSLSHDVAARYVATIQASAWAKTPAGRAKLPHALAESVTTSQSRALAAGGREFFGLPAEAGTSWQVRGLLTDNVHGGWRQDLSAEGPLVAAIGRPIADKLLDPLFSRTPTKGYPLARVDEGLRSLNTFPVLSDFRLSLGFFNSRSDGRHRLRFHGSVVLWNPLTVPVLAGPRGKIFLAEIVGSPEVTVTNLETSSAFVTDLDDCPQEDFGIIRQGLRERGLWFWVEVTDASNYGMEGRGLLPGAVGAFVSPDPILQPQGLARILTKMTWKMDRTRHAPGWKRPEPTVFLPDDRIEIALRFRGKVSIHLHPYAGEPSRDDDIADYPAKPVISLENIAFPDLRVTTTGEDYSREDSSGYVIDERRACLRVRLRPRDAGELWPAAAAGELARARWDFELPEDAAQWVVEDPLASALDVVDHDASPLVGPLWDLHPNRHVASEVGAFATIMLRDFPARPWLSVGMLRHLEPVGSKAWQKYLDGSFSSAPLGVPEVGVGSYNPFLIPVDMPLEGSKEVARGFQVVGPFNVNSRDSKAWEAFLRDASGGWKADAGGPFEPQELCGALFFTRPSGAVSAKWGSLTDVDISDGSVAALDSPAFEALAGQQGVRKLEEPKLAKLARKIVELQPEQGWPYSSLQAFAASGVLAQALEEADIDAPFASLASALPVRLRAEDLLEAWAPVLTARGDTFSVIGRAEGQGGSSVCEMIVQRVAEGHSVARLGRRLRIISVRFRNR